MSAPFGDETVSSRFQPKPEDTLDDDAARLLAKLPRGADGPLHLMSVLIENPDLLRRWGRFTGGFFDGSLDPRERELVILRTASNCQSTYEWGNHVELGLAAGLTDEEIGRLARRIEPGDWSESDLALLGAADELHEQGELSQGRFDELMARYGSSTVIELVFLVGIYHIVRSIVGSFGVLPEPGKPLLGSTST
jgi:4-carboxymuconolactone decarboxylase